MRKKFSLWNLGLVFLLASSCGSKAAPQTALNSPGAEPEEEVCQGQACQEQDINAPVGEQPAQNYVPYDQITSNPGRDTLRFPAFNPTWGLKRAIFDKAQAYFEAHKDSIDNPRYFMVVDFNMHSSKRRFFLFDLSNDQVERYNVAAGKNSDSDNDGYATKFSNTPNSLMSSIGFYKTLTTYNGGHGYSLKIRGLDPTNNNAEARAVVMHPADYVKNGVKAGRSWGCPALDPAASKKIIDRVRYGAILLMDK